MIFYFDASVLLYRFDRSAPHKQQHARLLWRQMVKARSAAISSQVLVDFIQAMQQRLQPALSARQLQIAVDSLAPMVHVGLDRGLILTALRTSLRYELPIDAALHVQAASECGASILYSETLPDGQRYGTVQIINPFIPRDPIRRAPLVVQEPAATYLLHADRLEHADALA